jgi:hypothetical protein
VQVTFQVLVLLDQLCEFLLETSSFLLVGVDALLLQLGFEFFYSLIFVV